MENPAEKKPIRVSKAVKGLPAIRANVAGIDLGSQQHWVCAPSVDGTSREVVAFGATTTELIRMVHWLKARHVESVALESTGVYWIAPLEVLEAAGFEILLVDTRQLARVPGRDKKSDPTDCEWLQRLHSCGLLSASFRPPEAVSELRTLVRDQASLVAQTGDVIRRMQKSLDQMNVRLHHAVSDINGVTGMAILRAIVEGERDARKLAKLRDRHCKKTEEEIAEELTGHWREDHLFSLRQNLILYDSLQERIKDYDDEIQRKLAQMTSKQCREARAPKLKNHKAKAVKKRGEEEMHEALYRMSGVDLLSIDAIGVETAKVVLSEYGPDLSRFPTEKHFVSHATLAPRKATSGGKPITKKKKRNSASTRVAEALRMAALSTRNSATALGAYYRSIKYRMGADIAVFATARKLATIIYRLLRWGQSYVDEGSEAYERRHQDIRVKALKTKAKDMGYELVANAK